MSKRFYLKAGWLLLIAVLLASLVIGCAKPAPAPAPKPAPAPAPTPTPPSPAPKPAPAPPAQRQVPSVVTIGGYAPTAGAGIAAAAMFEAIYKVTGLKVVMEPLETTNARTMALLSGRAVGAWGSDDTHWAVVTGTRDWEQIGKVGGPAPLQTLWTMATYPAGLLVPKDSPIKTVADIKGKRLAYIPLQGTTDIVEAVLYGYGITLKDVEIREYSIFDKAFEAVIAGQADVAYGSATAAYAMALEASPKGARALRVAPPEENPELWKRIWEKAPFAFPHVLEKVAGAREGKVDSTGGRRTIATWKYVNKDIIYTMAKGFWDGYDLYKTGGGDAGAGTHEWVVKPACIPWHEGNVEFFKEKGVWTPEMEKAQQELLARNQKYINDWEKATGRVALYK